MLPPKAESVDAQGVRDSFTPPAVYRGEVVGPGFTRLAVSVPSDRLAAVHQALVAALDPPLKVLYQRLTDRTKGQLPKPQDHAGINLAMSLVLETLQACAPLVYQDGRHQLWIEGSNDAKVILEETGVLYVYPDDPSFRDVLAAHDIAEGADKNMGDRDYVRVNFLTEADAMETHLLHSLRLTPWGRR